MSWLLQSLIPRSGLGIIWFVVCLFGSIFATFLFKPTHPEFLILLATMQGVWLGVWCQDLHQFAGSHVVPRFASRVMSVYAVLLGATFLYLAAIALANHDLFTIIGLLMAIIVTASLLILLIPNVWVSSVLICGIVIASGRLSDALREGVAELLTSGYLTPLSLLVLLLGLAFLYAQLLKPLDTTRLSLRQEFDSKNGPKFSGAAGMYGIGWIHHLKTAAVGILLSLAVFHFYERAAQAIHIGWIMLIVFSPVQNLGRSMGLAPRAWLSGRILSRSELSSALLVRLLGISGLYAVAALTLSLASNLLGFELPRNFELIVVASLAGSALGLGLIISYSSNLEEKKLSFERSVLLGVIYMFLYMANLLPIEFFWGFTGLFACAALYFLFRAYQRIANLEFITF